MGRIIIPLKDYKAANKIVSPIIGRDRSGTTHKAADISPSWRNNPISLTSHIKKKEKLK